MADERVELEIVAQFDKALRELEKFAKEGQKDLKKLAKGADASFDSIEDDAKKAAKDSGKAWDEFTNGVGKQLSFLEQTSASFFGNLAADFARAGIQSIAQGFRDLFDTFVTEGVAAAQVQEDAINQLNTSLALSGRFSKETSAEFQEYAKSLQQASTAGDEVIIKQLALANNFARSTKQAKDLTQAGLDLAAVTNLTLDSAITNLGKTTGGLVGELGEVLPELKNLTQEELKAGKAIEFVLERFGGAASAQIQTFSGAVTQAGNSFSDLQETIGFAFTESEAIVGLIQEFNKIFVELQETVKANEGELRSLVVNGIAFTIDAFSGLLEVIDFVQTGFQGLRAAFAEGLALLARIGNLAVKAALGLAELRAALGLPGADEAVKNLRNLENQLESFAQIQRDIAQEEIETAGERSAAIQGIIKRTEELSATTKRLATESADEQVIQNQKVIASTQQLTQAQKDLRAAALSVTEEIRKQNIGDKLDQDLKTIQDAFAQQLITRQQFLEAQAQLDQQILERDLLKETERAERAEQELEKDIERLRRRNELLKEIDDEQNAAEIARNQQLIDAKVKQAEKGSDLELKLKAQQVRKERELDQQRLEASSQFFGNLSSLQRTGSRNLFEIGKAAAVAGALIDGFAAVQKALASAPPPFNFALAASVGVRTAVQVDGIRGTTFNAQTGLTEVPPGFPNDSFPANLTSGERVVSAPQNEDLKQFLRDNSENTTLLQSILGRLSSLEMAVTVNIGTRQIVNEINRASAEGFVIDV